ncbi:MAG: helix-turn-helix domain-containing protein [Firmicutes bacterium]|nr:helix-turn-helix domain-containing protein [Bacillota bacterium]
MERALDVLEALAASDGSLGVSELTRQLHLDKATVFRILTALARRGYVRQDGPTRKYRRVSTGSDISGTGSTSARGRSGASWKPRTRRRRSASTAKPMGWWPTRSMR